MHCKCIRKQGDQLHFSFLFSFLNVKVFMVLLRVSLILKVEFVRGEAESQRLQREELEMELEDVRHQMLTLPSSGSNIWKVAEDRSLDLKRFCSHLNVCRCIKSLVNASFYFSSGT